MVSYFEESGFETPPLALINHLPSELKGSRSHRPIGCIMRAGFPIEYGFFTSFLL